MVARLELIKALASIVPPEVLVVTSIGNNSYFWAELTDREATLYHSTLGMCTPAAFGLAMALPRRKVLALDSDGNLILNLGVLGTIANENPTNLTILVMDNGNYLGSHKREPGMRTATGGKMKLEEVATGCGIASSHAVQDVAKFRERVQSALRTDGPHFIRAEVEALDLERPPKTKHVLDPRENKYQFAKYIERTEGVQILGGGLGNFG
ncbi:MAG TPA: thiamine pyrophosphate-dependent enzyme [Candidatus Binatia bacterium]|nr:thiamine pyrophosphate-dependent enzyme [Candidatus Binatia bacterium]